MVTIRHEGTTRSGDISNSLYHVRNVQIVQNSHDKHVARFWGGFQGPWLDQIVNLAASLFCIFMLHSTYSKLLQLYAASKRVGTRWSTFGAVRVHWLPRQHHSRPFLTPDPVETTLTLPTHTHYRGVSQHAVYYRSNIFVFCHIDGNRGGI